MTRCKKICADIFREVEELSEFNFAIATDAGIWRSPAQIFFDEIIFNLLTKNFSEVGNVMRYAQMFANFSGVGNIFVVVEEHRHADNFKIFFKQNCRSQRAVNASAHGNGNFFFHDTASWFSY